MSTHAPNTRPVATETHLSHGSACMPRVAPAFALKLTLCCFGVSFWPDQFSLNQPRLSSWTVSW